MPCCLEADGWRLWQKGASLTGNGLEGYIREERSVGVERRRSSASSSNRVQHAYYANPLFDHQLIKATCPFRIFLLFSSRTLLPQYLATYPLSLGHNSSCHQRAWARPRLSITLSLASAHLRTGAQLCVTKTVNIHSGSIPYIRQSRQVSGKFISDKQTNLATAP